jgi:prepilin-type N-terminal cleavage/methylation domain-containing protein
MKQSRGFTVLEMLVAVAIIVVLAGVLLSALTSVRQRRLVLLAQKQVKDIAAALVIYHEQLHSYPPDTGDFGTGTIKETVFDPQSIATYLGSIVRDTQSQQEFGPFLNIPPAQLKNGIYLDPWGNPYQLDAVHIQCVDPEQGIFQRVGEPYLPGSPEKELRDFKVWSAGPDGKSGLGSKAVSPRTGDDFDNVTSWDD